ncbi:hypothetical protein G3M54_04580 [Bacillus megaterium NBRC 15308 = ATCC 14581]|nr:hypothetical protein [Priestia megaterium NBRC 15308 = ATCC 14581]
MTKTPSGFKRLNADIPEELFKEFAKRCIEEGVSKKNFLFNFWKKNSLKIQRSKVKKQNKGHFPARKAPHVELVRTSIITWVALKNRRVLSWIKVKNF